jgi:hypothetical protein
MSDEYDVRKGEGETGPGISLLFSKSTKVTARLNVHIRRTNTINNTIRFRNICIVERLGI